MDSLEDVPKLDADNFPITNVVVVRFSVRLPEWRRRNFMNEGNRKQWFAYRAELFRRTLGAAIASQSDRVAALFLLMDEQDQDLYRDYLQDDTIHPVFARKGHMEKVAREILRRDWTRRVAMSRIDSDDVIGRDYIRNLNAQIRAARAAGECPDLIVACRGYRSDFRRIQRLYYDASPFITRFMEHYAGDSVYTAEHQCLRAVPHDANTTAEWMQVIHGTNVANGFMRPHAPMPAPGEDAQAAIACTELAPVDPQWFAEWAGFALPDPALFAAAPVKSMRSRIRILLRRARGKM